ncbi:hypothetical protein SADUNF_Sadunf08G0071700 [Salix dunnii]|uniref:peptidylprolyl isomerase n=1 Tax=Salix dunnii TaxID=1413687 RepID=A0A835MTL3_9ROSI|nr:hypothetical protein SADUNF_Sadunf08G0071700 [Salix dunnii]
MGKDSKSKDAGAKGKGKGKQAGGGSDENVSKGKGKSGKASDGLGTCTYVKARHILCEKQGKINEAYQKLQDGWLSNGDKVPPAEFAKLPSTQSVHQERKVETLAGSLEERWRVPFKMWRLPRQLELQVHRSSQHMGITLYCLKGGRINGAAFLMEMYWTRGLNDMKFKMGCSLSTFRPEAQPEAMSGQVEPESIVADTTMGRGQERRYAGEELCRVNSRRDSKGYYRL